MLSIEMYVSSALIYFYLYVLFSLNCKFYLFLFLPSITSLFNASLQQGNFPVAFRHAVIRPLLKKSNLSPANLKNYRPVSNLVFLSKVLEKIVSKQLVDYINTETLYDPLQSAYRVGHSVETALVKVKSDIDLAFDEGDGVVLVLLDLSAAFDTINHARLLQRLRILGIDGVVLSWFASYLQQRTQSVMIGDVSSDPSLLSTGVPQGSVLGPTLFTLYVKPMTQIIESHGICRHSYADDVQLYTRFSLNNEMSLLDAIDRLGACISDVRAWLHDNALKLNDDKTEFIIFAPAKCQQIITQLNPRLTVGSETISSSSAVRNLGATFDSSMSMIPHVSNLTKNIYFHLRRIKTIRPYLDNAACAKAIHAIISSRLDCNNSLLVGLPEKTVARLQIAQNCAARLLSGAGRRQHITPILQDLHWLPVKERIQFKTLCLVYKAVHEESSPAYLKSLVRSYVPSRQLRSASDQSRLLVHVPRTKTYGERLFCCSVSRCWNALSISLRQLNFTQFRAQLKTHLFRQCFLD